MNPKIVELEELSDRSEKLRAAGKKIVATNGCFDLLHVGHVRYLQAARALGDVLAVGLNGDRSVRELKGTGRPLRTENDRAEILAALQCVDLVTVFPQIRATQFLAAVRPAVYAKGADYTPETLNEEERSILTKTGAEIRLIPFEAGYSTSRLIEEICKTRSSIAREFGVPNAFLPPGRFRTRLEPEAEDQLVKMLRDAGVELVALAGFMRVLHEPMLNAFPRRVINIHPSLLPKFPGLEAWKQALAAGEKVTGCTVHYVDEKIDHGRIVAQREATILPNDTPESLHSRIQILEHELYPAVIAELCERYREANL